MKKKIFKTKQFVILIILILFLIGIWFLLAFLLKEESLPRYSLWATLVFGTGTIITSVISLGISILSFRKNEELLHQRVIDDANKFIDENSSEILYIPLCLIANAYNSHHKYNREIYNKFNILNPEIKKEVLNQLQYEYPIIKNSNWIESGIDVIRKFIQENDLGKDGLYDGAKYFHRAMKYARLPYDLKCEFKHIMPDTFKFNSGIFPLLNENDRGKITFHNYVLSYLEEKNKNSEEFNKHKEEKPFHNYFHFLLHDFCLFADFLCFYQCGQQRCKPHGGNCPCNRSLYNSCSCNRTFRPHLKF